MQLLKSLGWISQVVVVFLAAGGFCYWIWVLDTKIEVFKPAGWISLVVVSALVLSGIYYEIKDRCSKKEQVGHAPKKGKWFFEQAELTFPVTFAVICTAGLIAFESIKASMG